MKADVLIIGQGLAGSLLGWACEKAGLGFAVVDRGHDHAASAAAAGIVNPITGRRLVKSWRVDAVLPEARTMYREIEDAVGAKLWHPMRVRRLFADDRERATYAAKCRSGELAPFGGDGDSDGFWIEGAARVDLDGLLGGLRQRWIAQGRLRAAVADSRVELERAGLVIDCTGTKAAQVNAFAFVPWEYAKGEILKIRTEGLVPGVVLNRRHWLAPISPTLAWVGATQEPGVTDTKTTDAARARLEASARALGQENFTVVEHRAGVRVNLPDKLPVVGRHPDSPRLGLINGLGAKGALYGPMLARAWVDHLREGASFDPALDVRRFSQRGPALPK